jgi:hypothetical protein
VENNPFTMITDFKEIERSALKLDKKSKARLADSLLQSIHGQTDPEIEKAWIDEVQHRKESLESGEVTLHPSSEVLQEARKHIQK